MFRPLHGSLQSTGSHDTFSRSVFARIWSCPAPDRISWERKSSRFHITAPHSDQNATRSGGKKSVDPSFKSGKVPRLYEEPNWGWGSDKGGGIGGDTERHESPIFHSWSNDGTWSCTPHVVKNLQKKDLNVPDSMVVALKKLNDPQRPFDLSF